MEMDYIFFLIAVPAVAIAGISKGGFGSGAAFVATPILALRLEPQVALGLMLPLLMLIDLAVLRPYWRQWSWAHARVMVIGGALGTALAVGFYQITDADALRVLIGAISILFVAYQLLKGLRRADPKRAAFKPGLGFLTGTVAGYTSFVSHAGGPPVAMYLLSQRMDKTTYQATTVIVFWMINILKAFPYAWLGIFTLETLKANVILAPVALLATWVGVIAHRHVPEWLFFGITYTLLIGAGGKLLIDGLT